METLQSFLALIVLALGQGDCAHNAFQRVDRVQQAGTWQEVTLPKAIASKSICGMKCHMMTAASCSGFTYENGVCTVGQVWGEPGFTLEDVGTTDLTAPMGAAFTWKDGLVGRSNVLLRLYTMHLLEVTGIL